MSHNIEKWRELQNQFQMAYAEHGEALFGLYAITVAERGDSLVPGETWAEGGHLVGHVMLDETKHMGYSILTLGPGKGTTPLAEVERQWLADGFRLEAGFQRALVEFERLSSIAGASLPSSIRAAIPVEPAGPTSYWLATMFWSDERKVKEFGRYKKLGRTRLVWSRPFFDSMQTIERCKLLTQRPSLSCGKKSASRDYTPSENELNRAEEILKRTPSITRDALAAEMGISKGKASESLRRLGSRQRQPPRK